MYNYALMQWLFFFYVYCFMGWCIESAYVSICIKKITNRGFMRGPWLPIYGSGALVMLVCASPFMKYPPVVFLSGMVGASILEFVTGECMENLFKVRYWDYSNKRFNIKGQVCLLNSTYWGILTLCMNYVVHKYVDRFMHLFSYRVLGITVVVLTVLIGIDFGISFKAALDMREILVQLDKAREEMSRIQKRLDVLIAVASDEVHEELEELKVKYAVAKDRTHMLSNRKDIIIKRLITDNPMMVSRKFQDALDTLKMAITHKE